MGLPVVLQDGEARHLVALVETMTEARLAALRELGTPEIVVTARRAAALGIAPAIPSDTLRLRLPDTAGRDWIAALSGQNGPGCTDPGDALPRPVPGTAPHDAAIRIAVALQSVPAILVVPLSARDDPRIAALGLGAMPLPLVADALLRSGIQSPVSAARLPMDASEAGRVQVFRPDDGGAEHFAIEIGAPDLSAPVMVRLHSACFTGDVLGSRKCDCGPQLRASMAAMAEEGGGVLLYLNQEGRGIGLANKLRAYALQDAGLDTVEANHWLGFEDDQRDFRIGARMLASLGISQVRLMTNNPAKTASLAAHGIDVVDRVPLRVGRTAQNAQYLATKAAKSGHLL
ncbi:GTP cyclohydrolase II [Palleronia sp. LCG004]|uniref:GTP cyclohydrolase II n=1 Tax=Palleronia sp. LCG004 TaxID=3079304 RepID=UPI00294363C3|nr:GTP cyclohydrolase II [Palleronia sp. LCG004]WOI58353.1 GTP cyclohydrolase II [Palleronia sp. LCG004]